MTTEKISSHHTPDSCHSSRLVLSQKQNRLLNVFFGATAIGTFLALLGITLYYICAFAAQANGSHAFDWLLGIFSDFVAIMNASLSDSPYLDLGVSYPPLAIALLYPFAWICKGVLAPYADIPMHVDELTSKVVSTPQFWVAYVLFFLICASLIVFAVLKKYRLALVPSLKLATTIILSTPFVYAVMRGNVIYFALIFLLIFMLWYDHENPVLRELSYVALALAGIIKIYPLFFGVFLLHKKKWFASFRVGFYFAVGTCLSFFLYRAGLDNFSPFLEQLGGFMNEGDRLLSGVNLSLTSSLFKLFHLILPTQLLSPIFRYTNLAVLLVVFLLSTVTAAYTRSNFSRAVIASAIVVLIPSVSYFYVLIFTLIPFFEFLCTYDTLSRRRQIFYTVCFLLLFFTPTILAKNFLAHALIVMLMLGVEIREVASKEMLPAIRARKNA